MFKILNFQNKIVEKLLVFRCSEIPHTTYDTIMQNKPNFRKSQMNVSIFSKMDYENKPNWTLGESKPKQSQSQRSVFCKNAKKNCIIQPRGFYLSVKFATLLKQECKHILC